MRFNYRKNHYVTYVTCSLVFVLMSGICLVGNGVAYGVEPEWTSSNNRYRILLEVDPLGISRTHSPAEIRINFQQELANQGGSGTFDEHTIEVISYDLQGQPLVYDATRAGYEQYLIPWRIEKYYGIEEVDLIFIMPDHNHRQFAVYFDTIESGFGRPDRYPGIVGDGDYFREEYKRREIGPSKFGDLCDFDGDGDLDLFEGGVEPFIYCYENIYDQVGEHKFVERGRMTSNGQLFILSHNLSSNRAWMTVTFYDWDGDGDQDIFPSFMDGPECGQILYYKNTNSLGGQLTFTNLGRIYTVGSIPLGRGCGAGWFPTPTFVEDWDGTGDGLTDVIVAQSGYLYLHRNLGAGGAFDYQLDDGVKLQAAGADIQLLTPRVDCADMDGDGDLDLIATTHGSGQWYQQSVIYWYKNIGTRQNPQFAAPTAIGAMRHYYGGVKVGDFYGNDGLPDIAVGTFWHVNEDYGRPKSFGGLIKNLGPLNNPTFETVFADAGAFYTEEFQKCDVGQQNGVRSLDWDNDGDFDLVSSTVDGFALFHRNLNNNLYPLFAPAEKLMVGGAGGYPVEVDGPEAGYARMDIADWNNDQHLDLIIADEEARVWLFLNDGNGNDPPTFLAGTRIYANGLPIDGLGRGSVLVCDWNNDGKKDLLMGMAPKDNVSSPYHDWPYQDGDSYKGDDQGFLYYRNIGTDAAPVLAYPKWLRADGDIITYTRPNMGSFVDWDGDGIKDFIGCDFENNIRFYQNIDSGAPNNEPQLYPAGGQIIVEPFCKTQMISGADVVDWRKDGDLDIVTGQGHGGCGLRYYERDYIEDWQYNTFPIVSFGLYDPPPQINPPFAYTWTYGREVSDCMGGTNGTLPYHDWMALPNQEGYAYQITSSNSFDSTGNAQGWNRDDGSWNYSLPFSFPYYSSTYNSVNICTNGFIDFSSTSADWSNTPEELINNVRIAPLWDDLRTDTGSGYDIYIDEISASEVKIRWSATTFSGGYPCNFSVTLFSNGEIRFDYGTGNTGLTPTVGISAGNGTNYILIPGYDTAGSLIQVNSVYFTIAPGGPSLPPGISLDPESGCFSGTPTALGMYPAKIQMSDSAQPIRNAQQLFMFYVLALPGDFDLDDDVDQVDFGHMQLCMSGTGVLQTDPDCLDADLDADGDVDRDDSAIFGDCMSGPNVPGNTQCTD